MAEPPQPPGPAQGRGTGAVEWSPGQGEAAGKRLLVAEETQGLLQGGRDGASTGVAALINNATVTYERLPMLEVVFDRLVRIRAGAHGSGQGQAGDGGAGQANRAAARCGEWLIQRPMVW